MVFCSLLLNHKLLKFWKILTTSKRQNDGNNSNQFPVFESALGMAICLEFDTYDKPVRLRGEFKQL